MTTMTTARRPGGPDDAVGGVVPREVVRPTSAQEVTEVVRAAYGDGLSVVPVGSGSKTSWAMRVSKACRSWAICSTWANWASTSTCGPSSSMTRTATAPAG